MVVGKSSDTSKPANIDKLVWLWKKVKWLRKMICQGMMYGQKNTHTNKRGSIVQVSCSTKNVEEMPVHDELKDGSEVGTIF